MGAYFPDEAVAAIGDMERRENLVEALAFVHDWIGRVMEGMEE
jgi:hypothetical protein